MMSFGRAASHPDDVWLAMRIVPECQTHLNRVLGAATLDTYRKSGEDGILHIEIAVGVPNSEFDVVVVLQPKTTETEPEAPDSLGWPKGYFEQTAGSIVDPTFRRHDQGEFEKRLEF